MDPMAYIDIFVPLTRYMGVSKNRGFYPQIIHFNRGFPLFSPSILGVSPCFWKHPSNLYKSNKTTANPVIRNLNFLLGGRGGPGKCFVCIYLF